MGIILIFSIRNYNYKSTCILQTHGKIIYFVRTCKPKSLKTRPNQNSPVHVPNLSN